MFRRSRTRTKKNEAKPSSLKNIKFQKRMHERNCNFSSISSSCNIYDQCVEVFDIFFACVFSLPIVVVVVIIIIIVIIRRYVHCTHTKIVCVVWIFEFFALSFRVSLSFFLQLYIYLFFSISFSHFVCQTIRINRFPACSFFLFCSQCVSFSLFRLVRWIVRALLLV